GSFLQHVAAFRQREERVLFRVTQDRHYQLFKNFAASRDQVEVAVGERIEGPGIDGNNVLQAASVEVEVRAEILCCTPPGSKWEAGVALSDGRATDILVYDRRVVGNGTRVPDRSAVEAGVHAAARHDPSVMRPGNGGRSPRQRSTTGGPTNAIRARSQPQPSRSRRIQARQHELRGGA